MKMSNQETYEMIEAYLNGTLTGTKLTDFEARLQTDQELADQVLLFKEMDEAVSDESVLKFQELVQSEGVAFIKESDSEKAGVKSIGWPRRYLAIAASLLVLVVSTLIFWNIQRGAPTSGQELFAQYFEAYDLNKNLRSGETVADDVFRSGVQQYQTKDFEAAAQTFQKLAATADQDMVLAFCLANAYLNQQTPQLEFAAQQFQKVIEEGESIYVPRAKWYRALIHLEKEELKQAESLLKDVAGSKDNFGQKAAALLKSIAS